MPTPLRALEEAGVREILEPPHLRQLLEQNFAMLPCFGADAERARLHIYVGLLRAVASLEGLRLEDVSLDDVRLHLSWEQPSDRQRAAGRVGALAIDATLAFERATLRTRVNSLWPFVRSHEEPLDLPVAFTGGRVDLRASVHVEGGVKLCSAAGRAEVPPHVIEYGSGIFLAIDEVVPRLHEARLTDDSVAAHNRILNVPLLNLPVLNVLQTADRVVRPVLRVLQTVREAGALVRRRRSRAGDGEGSSELAAPRASPSDILNLVVKGAVDAAKQVQGMPLVCSLRDVSPQALAYLEAAVARQREREVPERRTAEEQAAVEAEARSRSAALAAAARRAAAELAAAERSLLEAMQPRWFGRGIDTDGLEEAIASGRARGVSAILLDEAKATLERTLAEVVVRRAVAAAMAADEREQAERTAAAKLAADVLAAEERAVLEAMQPRWFGRGVDAEALESAIARGRTRQLDRALIARAEAELFLVLGTALAQRAVGTAVAAADMAATERAAEEKRAAAAKVAAERRAVDELVAAEKRAAVEVMAAERALREAMQPRWFGRGVDTDALEEAIARTQAKSIDAIDAALMAEAEALCNEVIAAGFARRVMQSAAQQA